MEKASGVYLTITDNSFIAQAGTQVMKVIVPMLTTKGKVGFNYVTADTFKDVVGYDLEYNSNYYGLQQILQNVSYAQVWRLNQDSKLANAYFASKTSDKAYNDDADTVEDVTMMDPKPLIAIGNKSTGNWQTSAVKINPLHSEITQQNTNATRDNPQIIVLDVVNETEMTTLGDVSVLDGLIFYNSSDNAVVGAIKKNADDEWKVYKVVDGELVDDEMETVTTDVWKNGSKFLNASMQEVTEPEGTASTPVEIGVVRETGNQMYKSILGSWFKVDHLTTTAIITEETPVSDTDIITALEAASDETIQYVEYSDEVFAKDNSVGSVTFDVESTTITLIAPVSRDSFWNIHTLPETLTDWTLTLASYDGRNYQIQKTYNFSTNVESEMYVENVDFGDLFVQIDGSIPADMESIRSYFTLEGGSNGLDQVIAANIDTSILDNCGYNIMAMNGLTDHKVINKIATKIKVNKIHLFADAPAYASYIDVETWEKKIAQSEYLAVAGRPDKVQIGEDKYIYLYPSVNYIYILSQMLANYGSLNYPPAGPTYGLINTEELIECDYELYANELKTNRINWQRTNNVGTMMWEQRTTYALNTDLSYIAPVFIVDQVAEDIVTFEQQFNFRYMTKTDILNQDSGLTSILQDYVDKGFLYSFNLHMPTYEEAQKAGRTLTIPIEIVIMKDSEVIEINLILNNAQ